MNLKLCCTLLMRVIYATIFIGCSWDEVLFHIVITSITGLLYRYRYLWTHEFRVNSDKENTTIKQAYTQTDFTYHILMNFRLLQRIKYQIFLISHEILENSNKKIQ